MNWFWDLYNPYLEKSSATRSFWLLSFCDQSLMSLEKIRFMRSLRGVMSANYFLFCFIFCHNTDNNTKIMNKEKKKEESMMATVARRPKGNCEAYVN